jgi:hypothetical protein
MWPMRRGERHLGGARRTLKTLTRDTDEKDGSEAPKRGSEHNDQTPKKDKEKRHWGEALWTHTEDAEENAGG